MADSRTGSGSSHYSDDDLLANAIPIESDDEDEGSPSASSGSDELEPIDLESELSSAENGEDGPKIRAFGERKVHEEHWKRKPNITGKGAIHVKTFIAKLRLDSIDHLDQQINEWLDTHPEYEVKFVTTTIGPLVGKLKEDALFVNVWV